MANMHVKGSSTSSILREMQIKMTKKYYYISIKMALKIKSITKYWPRYGATRNLMRCWWNTAGQFLVN